MNDDLQFRSPMKRLNPDLGWFFYDPDENASGQETREFAQGFLAFLDSELAKNATALQSRIYDSESSGTNQTAADSVIVYPSHSGVYFPASYFASENEVPTKLQGFVATPEGKPFANWTLERDSEAHASNQVAEAVANPVSDQSLFEDTIEVLETSKIRGESSRTPIQVYWHLLEVMAEPLWPFGKGEGVEVAVLDTGLDPNNALLTTGSLGGVSFVTGNPSYNDDNGHGTHVTGIIAARPGTHSSGRPLYWAIAPGCRHYTVKVLNNGGSGQWAWIASGIDWARGRGVDIINMSLGGSQAPPTVVQRAINLASQRQAIIAAAGNNGPNPDTVTWPARYRPVIGVGAVDRNRNIARFSSRGPADPNAFVEDNVECVAPGVDVYSNQLGGGAQSLVKKSGTSMASPIVSGICALLKQKDRSLSGTTDFRFRLRRSFIDLGIGGPDNWYGLGLAYFNPQS